MGYLQELDQLTEALKRPEYVALVRKWVYPGALASTRGESVKVGKLFGDVMHSGSAGPQTTKLVEHNGFLFVFHGSKFHKKSWFLVLPEGYDVQRDVNIAYSRLLSEAGGWLGTEGNLDALWKKLGRETLFGSEHSNMDVLKGQELQSCLLHEGLDLIVIDHDDFCSVATPSDHTRSLKNELRAEVNFVICKNSKTVTTFAGHHFISTKQIEPNRVVDYIREASKMKVCNGDNGSNREQALRRVDLFSKLASTTTDLIAESPNGVQVEFNGGCLLQRSKECNRIAQEVPCLQCKQQLKSGKRINQANTVTKDNHAWSLMNRNQLLSTLKSKQNRIRRLQRQVRYRDTLEKHEHETVRLRSDHSHLAESILVQALSHDEGSLLKPPKEFEGGVLHCLLKDHISRMKMRDEGKSLCGFRWHPKVLSYLLLLCDSMGESKYKIFNRIFDLPTWRSIRNYRQKDRLEVGASDKNLELLATRMVEEYNLTREKLKRQAKSEDLPKAERAESKLKLLSEVKEDGVPDLCKYGVLSFDGMKICSGLTYCPNAGLMIGFDTLKSTQPEDLWRHVESSPSLGGEAYVFVWRTVVYDFWHVVSFHNVGEVTSERVWKMLNECLRALSLKGLFTIAVVMDGATAHRSMLHNILHEEDCDDDESYEEENEEGIDLGSQGKRKAPQLRGQRTTKKARTAREGPSHESRRSYFIDNYSKKKVFVVPDPSHLIKKERNQLFNRGFLEFNEQRLLWSTLQTAYDYASKDALTSAPNLTSAHFELDAFSKMRVYLASQVLSKSMASLLDDLNKLTGEPVDSLQRYLVTANDAFDAMNNFSYLKPENADKVLSPLKERLAFLDEWFQQSLNQDQLDALDLKALKASKESKGNEMEKNGAGATGGSSSSHHHNGESQHRTRFSYKLEDLAPWELKKYINQRPNATFVSSEIYEDTYLLVNSMHGLLDEYVGEGKALPFLQPSILTQDLVESLFGQVRQRGTYRTHNAQTCINAISAIQTRRQLASRHDERLLAGQSTFSIDTPRGASYRMQVPEEESLLEEN